MDAPPQASRLHRIAASWATRSLALGALATSLDLALGTTLRHFGVPTSLAAMAGTSLGATFTFFGNRRFAFRDSQAGLRSAALKFVLVALTLNTIHGQLTAWLCDRQHLPYPVAKLCADLTVITFTQPLLLRYFVFPRPQAPGHSQALR